MASMHYCIHENTVGDLGIIYDEWYEFDPDKSSSYEVAARRRLAELIVDMADAAAEYLDSLED